MGMYDNSWCNGCGKSVEYSANEETYCGECAQFYAEQTPQKLTELIAYMKLHLISLEQDSEKLNKEMDSVDPNSEAYEVMDIEDISLNGQMIATRHLLSVAHDILSTQTKG